MDYLRRREQILTRLHPQWRLPVGEIARSNTILKRRVTPICIPPSSDLIQAYAGALDETASGFDADFYDQCKNHFAGDVGEAEFLERMQCVRIGGLLLANIASKQLLHGRTLPEGDREPFMLDDQLLSVVSNVVTRERHFELDFLYFHDHLGIVHIEVKRSSAKLKKLIKDAFDQLSRGILSQLFHEFCDVFGITDAGTLWNEFYGGGIVYATTVKGRKKSKDISRPQSQSCEYPILFDSDDFEQFWLSFLDEKLSSSPQRKCLFENNVFCLFTTFLAGYRPDFFISPVLCSLTVYENIFKHEINTINYYKTAKVGLQQRNTQNKSIKVSEFLQTLSIVKHKDIDLCEFSDFYLTAEQAQAIALIDSTGKFFPRRQIIFGPPGSGKSLVLMIKLFVLGQAEWRHDKTLYYGTSNEQHLKKLENFVANNRSAFCRPVEIVHAFEDDEVMRLRNAGADVILDELTDSQHSLAYLSDDDDDEQIVTFVTTGYVGSITHGLQASVWDTVNDSALKERNFLLTELKTVFRSTLQIQRWFHHFDYDRISNSLISGHNFTGIAVEEWIFTEERIVEAVNERIRILLEVEKCKPSHIVLYLPMSKHREYYRHIVSNPLKVITAFSELRSMEFPVVILVDPDMVNIYLSASRAQCHLIVFASENGARQLEIGPRN